MAEYRVGERVAARVYWHDSGAIEWEVHFDEQGKMHGREREEHPDGRRKYEARWIHGLQHGLQRQWDERGRLLGQTRFVRGTGVDLWWDRGRLTEQREYADGLLHGVERLWETRTRVFHEKRYFRGLEHGIWREWNDRGGFARGYPQYWIHGEKVTKRAYLRAAEKDPTLPEYDEKDDRPRRPFPPEAARKPGHPR